MKECGTGISLDQARVQILSVAYTAEKPRGDAISMFLMHSDSQVGIARFQIKQCGNGAAAIVAAAIVSASRSAKLVEDRALNERLLGNVAPRNRHNLQREPCVVLNSFLQAVVA